MNKEIESVIDMILTFKKDSSVRIYRGALRDFIRVTGVPIYEATSLIVMKYFTVLKKRRKRDDGTLLAAATIRLNYKALKSVCESLIDLELLERNPTRAVKNMVPRVHGRGKKPTKLIPFHMVDALIASCQTGDEFGVRNTALLATLFGAGVRISEALGLQVGDVTVNAAGNTFLELRDTKANEDQTRILAQKYAEHLHELVKQRISEGAKANDFLFVPYGSRKGKNKHLTYMACLLIFKARLKGLGLQGSLHSARATFATRLKTLGREDRSIAEALGHTGLGQVQVYDKRNNADRLALCLTDFSYSDNK